jgi:hypothetical protein
MNKIETSMDFCSPSARNRKICYSIKSLSKIIKIWNLLNPLNKIIINKTDSYNDIITNLNKHFKNSYWSWIDILKIKAKTLKKPKIYNDLIEIERDDLRPAQPIEWVKNPVEWLSNFDIIKVMRQYEKNPDNYYKFIGVFSIDFGKTTKIDVRKIMNSGKIKYFGFITNLSRSTEPGTHWTSSFFILDPSLPSFGGYYYDSTTGTIPNDLRPVFVDIKKQVETIFKKPFPIRINTIRHQRSNTECGVFSIAFQVLWLNYLKINKNVMLDTIVNLKEYTDEKMKKLRFTYFRPNIKTLKKNL